MTALIKLAIFVVVLGIVLGVLAFLPSIDIDKDAVISSSAWHWVMAAMYFLPLHTVINIGSIVVGLGIFSLIVAVVKSIWDVLPFS